MQYVKFDRNKTTSEYNSLTTKDPDTIYFIKDTDTTSGQIIMGGVPYGGGSTITVVDAAEEGNTNPISSGGVYNIIGTVVTQLNNI